MGSWLRRGLPPGLTVLFSAMLMACATPSAAPAASPTTAARAPASGGSPGTQAASAPVATSASTAASPTSAAIAQRPAQSTAPGGGPPASGLQISVVPGGSEARYRAREQFAGAPAFSEAVGTTSAVEGQVLLDEIDKVVRDASRITVDLSTLRSDQQLRDRYLRDTTLQTGQHPTAQLVATEVRGLPNRRRPRAR